MKHYSKFETKILRDKKSWDKETIGMEEQTKDEYASLRNMGYTQSDAISIIAYKKRIKSLERKMSAIKVYGRTPKPEKYQAYNEAKDLYALNS
jgi:hypothetical protein